MEASVHCLMKKRMERYLEQAGAVTVTIANGEEQVVFNVGPKMLPPDNLQIGDRGFQATVSVRRQPVAVDVHWPAVLKVEPYRPTVKFV